MAPSKAERGQDVGSTASVSALYATLLNVIGGASTLLAAASTYIAYRRLMTEALGWASSATLLFTIVMQIHKQWASGTSKGVSVWLFVGQAFASLGFLGYSWLIRNWVFVVTNALLAAAACVGLFIVAHHRRRGA